MLLQGELQIDAINSYLNNFENALYMNCNLSLSFLIKLELGLNSPHKIKNLLQHSDSLAHKTFFLHFVKLQNEQTVREVNINPRWIEVHLQPLIYLLNQSKGVSFIIHFIHQSPIISHLGIFSNGYKKFICFIFLICKDNHFIPEIKSGFDIYLRYNWIKEGTI